MSKPTGYIVRPKDMKALVRQLNRPQASLGELYGETLTMIVLPFCWFGISSNGRNKMHWFFYRDGDLDGREYREDSRGYLIRYASFETAQRAADKLNAGGAGIMRYVVPYSAPGIKRGQLRIDAESSAEAIVKAREIHEKGRYRATPEFRTGGPGAGFGTGPSTTPRRLAKRERSQIVYGEPSPGFWLSPSAPASWPASSNVAQTEGR